jgi:hypothetical protein
MSTDRRAIGAHERGKANRVASLDAGHVQLRDRYLDLLEQTLAHTAYARLDVGRTGANPLTRRIARLLARRAIIGLRFAADDHEARSAGRDWPVFAYTMSGVERLRNTRRCVERALADGVEGDLVEAGTWRGGSAMMMKGTLCAYGDEQRRVYVADTFAGLPAPTLDADHGSRLHREPLLAVAVEEVRGGFERLWPGVVRRSPSTSACCRAPRGRCAPGPERPRLLPGRSPRASTRRSRGCPRGARARCGAWRPIRPWALRS